MVKIVDGDLMKASENIIAHQVNCQGKMASGVAKSIRNNFPEVYEEYMNMYNLNNNKGCPSGELLGTAQIVDCRNKIVCNIFAQDTYGYDGKNYTDVNSLERGLKELYTFAKENNYSAALPFKIGSCRGGADWNEVYKIIEDIFNDDVLLTLYRLDLN